MLIDGLLRYRKKNYFKWKMPLKNPTICVTISEGWLDAAASASASFLFSRSSQAFPVSTCVAPGCACVVLTMGVGIVVPESWDFFISVGVGVASS